MVEVSRENLQQHGLVTEETWSDPKFRAEMRSKILDTGAVAIVRCDRTQPARTEDTHKVERKVRPCY